MLALAPLRVGGPLGIARRGSSSGGGAAEARTPLSHSHSRHSPPVAARTVVAAATPGPRVAPPSPSSSSGGGSSNNSGDAAAAALDGHRRRFPPPPSFSSSSPFPSPRATLLLCGDRHSHVSAYSTHLGDDAAHAPVALYGNFAVVGPAAAVKMPDGSLLVTLPARGGGHVDVPRGGSDGGGGGSARAPAVDIDDEVLHLGAGALRDQQQASPAGSGRCVLHGELMQLSGRYRVVDAPAPTPAAAELPSWPAPASPSSFPSSSSSAELAVHRRCGGGPRTHTRPLDVLTVASLPVGASLVLQAGARLSHPLNATPACSSLEDEEDEDEAAEEEEEADEGCEVERALATAFAAVASDDEAAELAAASLGVRMGCGV